MRRALLINGLAPADPAHAIAAGDRGFHYGDGVFETILVADGRARFLDAHLRRLSSGCERLGITPPDRTQLLADIAQVIGSTPRGVLKIIVSRGEGTRGYRPFGAGKPTRLVALYDAPELTSADGIAVRWCSTRLGRNARLAGIKHLNRLEQILARGEWDDDTIEEGLMLDTEGEVVCATAANIFVVREGVLVTPDLRFCGVCGVMREQVLSAAARLGLATSEEPLWPHDVESASEVFITNAVRGIRPVKRLDALTWQGMPLATKLQKAIDR